MPEPRPGDIDVNAEQLLDGIARWLDPAIAKFDAQRQAYADAEAMVASHRGSGADFWVGGYGGTGRVQEESHGFLDVVAERVTALRIEQDTYVNAMTLYAQRLRDVAHHATQTDNFAAEQFNNIIRDLDEKGRR